MVYVYTKKKKKTRLYGIVVKMNFTMFAKIELYTYGLVYVGGGEASNKIIQPLGFDCNAIFIVFEAGGV